MPLGHTVLCSILHRFMNYSHNLVHSIVIILFLTDFFIKVLLQVELSAKIQICMSKQISVENVSKKNKTVYSIP